MRCYGVIAGYHGLIWTSTVFSIRCFLHCFTQSFLLDPNNLQTVISGLSIIFFSFSSVRVIKFFTHLNDTITYVQRIPLLLKEKNGISMTYPTRRSLGKRIYGYDRENFNGIYYLGEI